MKFFDYAVTFREMPFNPSGSLTFFTGGSCKYNCKGCSWGETKPEGTDISLSEFQDIIKSKRKHVDAICFLGEGADYKDLIPYLEIAKSYKFTTMLYTGGKLMDFKRDLLVLLDYIKVGRWEGKTLYDEGTNQRVYKLTEGVCNGEVCYDQWR